MTTTDPKTDRDEGEQDSHYDLESLTELRDAQEKRLQKMRCQPMQDFASRFNVAAIEKNIEWLNRRIMAIKRTEPRASKT